MIKKKKFLSICLIICRFWQPSPPRINLDGRRLQFRRWHTSIWPTRPKNNQITANWIKINNILSISHLDSTLRAYQADLSHLYRECSALGMGLTWPEIEGNLNTAGFHFHWNCTGSPASSDWISKTFQTVQSKSNNPFVNFDH